MNHGKTQGPTGESPEAESAQGAFLLLNIVGEARVEHSARGGVDKAGWGLSAGDGETTRNVTSVAAVARLARRAG